MADDQSWRLRAEPGESEARRSLEHVLASVRGQGGGRSDPELPRDVVVTHDGKTLFAYAASEASLKAARSAIQLHAPQSSIVTSHWDEQLDQWLQVDPALTGPARQREEAVEQDAERVETRTLVTSAGKLIRAEVEASMQQWAQKLRLRVSIQEHRHLLTYQVLFEVTGPKRKIDEFAAGLNAEEHATMRAERMLMMSPL
jgi:hypothetical protein